MQAKDVMTKDVVVVGEQTTIEEAITKLIDHRISGAPVVDKNGDMIAVVTEKDLLVSYDFTQNIKEPITDFMSKDIIGVAEETPIEEISQMLVQKNVKRVPVLKGKKVVGVVSRRDILKAILKKNGK